MNLSLNQTRQHSGSVWKKLGLLNWFWQFFCNGYLSLTWKDYITHMHGLAVHIKEGLLFAWDLSLENSMDCYWCFWLALLDSLSCLSIDHRLCDSVSSNIDEILLTNPSANVLVFGDFNIHHKDWLTYSSGTDKPSELCYNFCISLLTSVFHKGLSFMAVVWGLGAAFGGSSPLVFKLPFHASFSDLIMFSFLGLFFFLHRHFISFMTPKGKKE